VRTPVFRVGVYLAVAALSCVPPPFPIYRYESVDLQPSEIETRLVSLLESEGYEPSKSPKAGRTYTPYSLYTRCKLNSDLVVWQKALPPRSFPSKVWHTIVPSRYPEKAFVYQFRCDGQPWFDVDSSFPLARQAEAARMRRLLNQAFAEEVSQGHIRVGEDVNQSCE